MVLLPVFGIFNVLTDVDPDNYHRGCMDIVRESALKADSGRKLLPHWKLEPASVLR